MNFAMSPTYTILMRNAAIVATLVAIVATIIAFASYGRAREAEAETGAPWLLLMSTLRDSFILTLLYSADSLIAQSSRMQEPSLSGDPFKLIMSFVSVFAGPIFQFLIIGIATLRVLALSRWLKARAE